MAVNKENDPYMLVRDITEAERLNYQHRIYMKCQGYHLHPDIPVPENARVADLATGTAIWLREFAQTHPGTECHGFDLSVKMFPAASEVPSNVTLHMQDLKEPFDAQWHGYFDAVHLRLLQVAMAVPDWALVLRNVVRLLKPGGWLQWAENDTYAATRQLPRPPAPAPSDEPPYYNQARSPYRPPKNRFFRMANSVIPPERGEGMLYGFLHLDRLFEDPEIGNLEQVDVDTYGTEQSAESRRDMMLMSVAAIESFMRVVENTGSIDLDEWKKGVLEEVDRGEIYLPFKMANFIGRKKRS